MQTGFLVRCAHRGGAAWDQFRSAQLFDYNAAAIRYWLVLALVGALALAWAGGALLHAAQPWQLLGWLALVALASAFPIPIPRSKLSIATADIVVFLVLALHGPAAAVLAVALEGWIAARRSSQRLTSHVATPAANAVSMVLAGAVFSALPWLLTAAAATPAVAHLAALAAAALVYCSASTLALMQVVYLKRGLRMGWRDWFEACSWIGTLQLLSAVIAGLLSLNAQRFGSATAAVALGVIALSLALLRSHFRQQIAAHDVQQARLALAEQEAQRNQQRFHAAFTQASIGMAIVGADGAIVQANQALHTLLGHAEGALVQRPFRSLLHAGDVALLDRQVAGLLARREPHFSTELRCLDAARRETWVSLHCAPFDDEPGTQGGGLIFQLHDISSRRRAEGALHHIAYHDPLTDLANRNCFHERLAVAVERSRNDRRYGFAVLVLGLDRFKVVNDSLGHPAGDALLKEAARRLAACVRPRDLVARLGGDEFAVLLEDTLKHDEALRLGERLLQALSQPAHINGTDLRPQASVGLTFSDMGYREADEVLRDADLAMSQAKADGKGRLALFDVRLHAQLGHRLQLEADLRAAIGDGQLALHYQPLFELQPHRLSGLEALARWTHPERGAISPAVFIALAEETGCIAALTAWAIDEAVRQHAQWRREEPAAEALVVHVNVSGSDLARPQFVAHVRATLQRHGLPPRLLVLEITESTIMGQREQTLQALTELRALGVQLGIDDFGTGYSSLAYLSTLPFDCLKIDRSFVIGMDKSPQNLEIVRTVISLGRTLHKQVVAEGIETHAQLRQLRALGAGIGQGYLLSRPLKPDQVLQLLREPHVAPA